MKIYQNTIESIAQSLDTDLLEGLSVKQAAERLKRDGPNVLPVGNQESWFSLFLSQFKSPLIYILLCASVIIFFVGERTIDAFIISGILVFNAIIGTIQEGRTSSILASLRQFLKTQTVVIRAGEPHIVQDQDIVVGDLIQ